MDERVTPEAMIVGFVIIGILFLTISLGGLLSVWIEERRKKPKKSVVSK